MTGNKKRLTPSAILPSIKSSAFHMEIKKSSRGAVAVVSGVMSVSEYTDSQVELLSHSGRMCVLGECLEVSVLEGRVIEIFGKITEVKFSYGRT